jgi:hypothetical protein
MATISNVYVQSFEQNVRHLAQQSQAKLRGTVQERGVSSEKHNWERLGPGAAVQKTGRIVATPVADLPWDRRVSLAETWHFGESTEQEDPVQMLVDPNSNIAESAGMAMRRAMDDVIIAAATGAATVGTGGTSSFPADQEIGDGTTEISFDFVTQVQEKFMDNDIDPDVPKTFVVSPAMVRKLMSLTQQTSSDYVRAQSLLSYGIQIGWMGFNWICSTRLLSQGAGRADALAYTQRAIGLQINKDITARIAEDPSVSFAWRIYTHMTIGAVRVEDEHIVRCDLLDSVA